MFYSQINQDEKVINFYNKKENGFFIEIGASDGIELSNTYLLETKYNWKGICCEPIPESYTKLVKNRPKSICCDKAVYHTSGLIVDFDISLKFNLLSGISKHIDKYNAKVNSKKLSIKIETISLSDLLDNSNAPSFIEYLSLDTEGTEYEILKNFNFQKYIFGLIHVEHNHIEPKRTLIRNLLLLNGYIYIGQNKHDDMYKHSSII
jgi:FkbM family methyltransferase